MTVFLVKMLLRLRTQLLPNIA